MGGTKGSQKYTEHCHQMHVQTKINELLKTEFSQNR